MELVSWFWSSCVTWVRPGFCSHAVLYVTVINQDGFQSSFPCLHFLLCSGGYVDTLRRRGVSWGGWSLGTIGSANTARWRTVILRTGSNDDCHYWSDFFEALSPTLFRRRWSATSLYFFFKALIFSRHYLLSHACPSCCSFSAIVLSMAMFLLALSSYLLIATSDQITNNALILTSIHDIWLILHL